MCEALRRDEEERQEGGGGEILLESADETAGGAEQADGEHSAEDGGRAAVGRRLPVRLRGEGRRRRVLQEHAQEDAEGKPLRVRSSTSTLLGFEIELSGFVVADSKHKTLRWNH